MEILALLSTGCRAGWRSLWYNHTECEGIHIFKFFFLPLFFMSHTNRLGSLNFSRRPLLSWDYEQKSQTFVKDESLKENIISILSKQVIIFANKEITNLILVLIFFPQKRVSGFQKHGVFHFSFLWFVIQLHVYNINCQWPNQHSIS